ncbi:MAG: DUF3088 family protein [Hyphomonadaceae bacterium]
MQRVAFPRPREAVLALIGEANQSLPALVLADSASPPAEAKEWQGRFFLDEPKPITRYLSAAYGGAGPHP